jgi:predicted DNA-binding protein with PD1-like motif
MRSHEITTGRTFGLAFGHGDDFMSTLTEFCEDTGLRQGYMPTFVAGFNETELTGTCTRLEDPDAPVWSAVHLTNVEALGGGTIAYDEEHDRVMPHIHVGVGLKAHSATGHVSHLLDARVQFLVEMVIVEVLAPPMRRVRDPDLYGVPLLHFG